MCRRRAVSGGKRRAAEDRRATVGEGSTAAGPTIARRARHQHHTRRPHERADGRPGTTRLRVRAPEAPGVPLAVARRARLGHRRVGADGRRPVARRRRPERPDDPRARPDRERPADDAPRAPGRGRLRRLRPALAPARRAGPPLRRRDRPRRAHGAGPHAAGAAARLHLCPGRGARGADPDVAAAHHRARAACRDPGGRAPRHGERQRLAGDRPGDRRLDHRDVGRAPGLRLQRPVLRRARGRRARLAAPLPGGRPAPRALWARDARRRPLRAPRPRRAGHRGAARDLRRARLRAVGAPAAHREPPARPRRQRLRAALRGPRRRRGRRGARARAGPPAPLEQHRPRRVGARLRGGVRAAHGRAGAAAGDPAARRRRLRVDRDRLDARLRAAAHAAELGPGPLAGGLHDGLHRLPGRLRAGMGRRDAGRPA